MSRYFFNIFVLIIFLTGCAGSNSSVKPPQSLELIHNKFVIKKIWQEDLGQGANDYYLNLRPILANNILFSIHYSGAVKAYNTKTNDMIWTVETGSKIGSPLTLYKRVLYFGTSEGEVIALDANTGKLIWKAIVSSEVISAPAVAGEFVVVRCVNGELHSLNSKDGSQYWSNQQRTPSLTLRGTSAPVIYNDLVISAFDNGKLIAYNLQSGNILWQKEITKPRGRSPIERIVDIDADLVIQNDVIYTTAFQGKIAAVQIGSGQILWSRDIGSYIGMAVDAYRIYLADSESKLWALDRNNGATLWKQDAVLRRSITKPVLHSGYIIVGDFNGFLHWFSRGTGKLEARARLKTYDFAHPDLDETEDLLYPKLNDILATPIVSGNLLIAMDRHGTTEAYEITYP